MLPNLLKSVSVFPPVIIPRGHLLDNIVTSQYVDLYARPSYVCMSLHLSRGR